MDNIKQVAFIVACGIFWATMSFLVYTSDGPDAPDYNHSPYSHVTDSGEAVLCYQC